MSRFGFIGVGDLALYTIRGVRHGGYGEPMLLSPRNREKAALLAQEYGCEIQASNQAVVDNCDCVIIATRPADCLQTLSELKFRPGQLLISVVAGMEVATLRTVLPGDLEVARAMPVSSAEVGASPTLVYPDNATVREFFAYSGTALPVDDEACFTQGSVLACVYCWFFKLFDTLIEANASDDLPHPVNPQLVMGMARGAAELALSRLDTPPRDIVSAIATEGTYSKLGLDLLQQRDAFAPWREACELLQQQIAAED